MNEVVFCVSFSLCLGEIFGGSWGVTLSCELYPTRMISRMKYEENVSISQVAVNMVQYMDWNLSTRHPSSLLR